MFLFERANSDSVISKKNNESASETTIEDKEYCFDYCFEFDKNTKSRFFRLSFNRLSKFKRLLVAYTTIYQKENNKIIFLRLEIEEINRMLIEISKFKKSIEKII